MVFLPMAGRSIPKLIALDAGFKKGLQIWDNKHTRRSCFLIKIIFKNSLLDVENPFKVNALDGFSFAYICLMFVDFETTSTEAKVWIYPSNRKFYPQEIDGLTAKLKNFIENWKANDEDFKASFQLKYNRFIIFSAEGASPLTNSDIDLQVAFILQLQQEYEVELLDRMNVCFKQGEFVQYKDLKEFKKLLKNRTVSEKTVVFDNLVTTKYDLENHWEVPITESWYNRFLK